MNNDNRKELSIVFNILNSLLIEGNQAELIAEAKARLRNVYKNLGASEEVVDDGG